MRRALIVAGLIVGAVAALVLYAWFNLDALIEANRGYLLMRASEALDRQVTAGAIKAQLGWGVELDVRDLQISDDPAFSPQPLLAAADSYVSVEFFPLLMRSLRITSVVITRPRVHLIRNRAGLLNLSEVGHRSPPAASLTGKAVTGLEKPAAGGLKQLQDVTEARSKPGLAAITIKHIAVKDAAVSYEDDQVSRVPLTFHRLNLTMTNVRADRPFSLDLSLAALSDHQDVSVSGTIGPLMRDGLRTSSVPISLKVMLGPLEQAQLKSLPDLAQAFPAQLAVLGPLLITGQLDGTIDALHFTAQADLGPDQVRYADWLAKPAGTPLHFDVKGDRKANQIALDRVTVNLGDLQLKASKIQLNAGQRSLHLDSNAFDLAKLAAVMPIAQKYHPTGRGELHTGITLIDRHPSMYGFLVLNKVNGTLPDGGAAPISDLSGRIEMAGNSAATNLTTFNVGSGHTTLRANAASLDPLQATYNLMVDSLKPGEILPKRSDLGEEVTLLTVSGKVNRQNKVINATAQLSSAAGVLANVAYRNLAASAAYSGDQLKLESMNFAAFDGTVAASGVATLGNQPTFALTLSASNVDLQKALAAEHAKAAATIRGRLTGNAQVAGAGTTFAQIRPTLDGAGRAALTNGKLVGVNVVAQALRKVDNLPAIGELVPASIIANHPELFQSSDTAIDQASLTFKLRGARLTSRDINVQTIDYTILGDGWFDMDRNLDVAARILLSPPFSAELVAVRKNISLLENRNRQVELPLRISGQLPKPAIVPDASTLAQRAATNAVEEHLDKLLGGKKAGGKGNPLNQLKDLFH